MNGDTTTRDGSRSAGDSSAEAESALADGLACYEGGDLVGAHAALERAHRKAPNDSRMMSWYGLTLLVERNSSLGMLYRDQALRLAGPGPELCLNLARVHVALGSHRARSPRPPEPAALGRFPRRTAPEA